MTIAVDFDGTCVKHKYPLVGEDVDGAVSVLKELVRKGHKIILYTMRNGRTYIATENRKIASVSIGYADGIPRNLSNKNMQVKINESYGTVVGRICMDQLLIDISDISNVKVGDIITIIGEDKNITAEQVADKADTITNELLCRLGDRLARIIV